MPKKSPESGLTRSKQMQFNQEIVPHFLDQHCEDMLVRDLVWILLIFVMRSGDILWICRVWYLGKVYEVRGAGGRGRGGIFIKSGDVCHSNDKVIWGGALLVHRTFTQLPDQWPEKGKGPSDVA